jgi:hypothetical protein
MPGSKVSEIEIRFPASKFHRFDPKIGLSAVPRTITVSMDVATYEATVVHAEATEDGKVLILQLRLPEPIEPEWAERLLGGEVRSASFLP